MSVDVDVDGVYGLCVEMIIVLVLRCVGRRARRRGDERDGEKEKM